MLTVQIPFPITKCMKNILSVILFVSSTLVFAQADWSRDFEVTKPRENIYQFENGQFEKVVMQGRKHALFYPVKVTELLMPYAPVKRFFDSKPNDPVRELLFKMAKVMSPFKNMTEMYSWLGLNDYPSTEQRQTPNAFPTLTTQERSLPMGATLIDNENGRGLTFGCATCHSADLFGVKVLGMTNRFPRANEFFHVGEKVAPYVNSFIFMKALNATEGERHMLDDAKAAMKNVLTKKPVVLGLDTSLAQVSLSLARRGLDDYATKNPQTQKHPRPKKLETQVADSKPAVWWNLKYKNRWLSDGSIVSGNPVFTNFLWNELGRGTDLRELEKWMNESQDEIEALTAAVFATKPPRYEKFFGGSAIDIEKARRGQIHFVQACQRCHGSYDKAWDLPGSEQLSAEEKIQTYRVNYFKKTPVMDVGTDPGRYLGMKDFADDLNRLRISQNMGTLVIPQKGYVPPPLVGIWARWPYFHNNSAPNLCAVLTRASARPKTYWAGAAKDKQTDYDQNCGGYPLGNKTPQAWKQNKEFYYDSSKEGLSNAGHDEKIIMKNGQEIFTPEQKLELVEFLKTL